MKNKQPGEHAPFLAAIFDLDGVLVDTANHHFLAWSRLARQLGIPFSREDNEALKGVSRMRSLELLLALGGLSPCESEKEELAARKNRWYVDSLAQIGKKELLDGAEALLEALRARGVKTAVGSASKNAALILERTGLQSRLDAVVDGNRAAKAKPDPEVFLLAAQSLGVPPARCVVFEDAAAGVEAALAAGMYAVGVGSPATLARANTVVPSVGSLTLDQINGLFGQRCRKERWKVCQTT